MKEYIEIWKPVPDYEGLYEVSNKGNVKSLERVVKRLSHKSDYHHNEKILKPSKCGWGYLFVNLHKDGNKEMKLIHRLVAQVFITNPDNLPCVNHKDENRFNNCVENLEWCSYKYNSNYGTCTKRSAEKRSIKVNQYTLDGELVKTWDSIRLLEKETGFQNAAIIRCCKHKQKTSYGYKWEYT